MKQKIIRYLTSIVLILSFLIVPLASAGCTEEKPPPPPASPPLDLARTLVPNTDLDIYLFVRQERPTSIPKDMIQAPDNLQVSSLAVWGVPAENDFTFGGAVTLTNAETATGIHSRIAPENGLWTTLARETIYFVQGSGTAARTLQAAIKGNDFKYYDDEEALREITLLPDAGRTKLAVVGIAKPGPELVRIIASGAGEDAAGMANMLFSLAQIQVVVSGLYAPEQIDIAELSQKVRQGKLHETTVGVLALVKSGLPGVVVSPAVNKFLEESGYTPLNLGGITVYRGFVQVDRSTRVPLFIRVEDNRIYLALSPQEKYAQLLITSIQK